MLAVICEYPYTSYCSSLRYIEGLDVCAAHAQLLLYEVAGIADMYLLI